MTAKLMDRIARLEAQQAPPPVADISYSPGIRLLWLLLAVHAGGLQGHEAIAEGVARACGYGRAGEMRAAMKAGGTDFIEWNSRYGAAVELLLATRRIGPSTGDTNEAAIRALVAEVPEEFHSYPTMDIAEEAIRHAAEWVSL